MRDSKQQPVVAYSKLVYGFLQLSQSISDGISTSDDSDDHPSTLKQTPFKLAGEACHPIHARLSGQTQLVLDMAM